MGDNNTNSSSGSVSILTLTNKTSNESDNKYYGNGELKQMLR